MTRLETEMLRCVMLLMICCCTASTTVMLGMAIYEAADHVPAWAPAAFAGWACSKYRRQREAEAELEQSLPIARSL